MSSDGDNRVEPPDGGVLSSLPRARPQRTSARRVAARARSQSETAQTGSRTPKRKTPATAKAGAPAAKVAGAEQTTLKSPASTSKASSTAKARRARATPKPKPKAPSSSSRQAATATGTADKPPAKRRAPAKPNPAPRAPRQGYEPEEEVELGRTVHPPSGGELIESLADIFSELVSAGAGAGGRLLKDALSVFRRP